MDDIIFVAETLFHGVWSMLLNIDFPGTDISLAALSLAVLVICFVVAIFKFLTGFSAGSSTYGRAADAMEKAKRTYDSRHKRRIGF